MPEIFNFFLLLRTLGDFSLAVLNNGGEKCFQDSGPIYFSITIVNVPIHSLELSRDSGLVLGSSPSSSGSQSWSSTELVFIGLNVFSIAFKSDEGSLEHSRT